MKEAFDHACEACEQVIKRILLLEQEVVDLRAANYTKKKKRHYPESKYSALRAGLLIRLISKALVH